MALCFEKIGPPGLQRSIQAAEGDWIDDSLFGDHLETIAAAQQLLALPEGDKEGSVVVVQNEVADWRGQPKRAGPQLNV
jgi:hypothetical protein